MRTLLAAVIGMAALAMSPTSAFAHHNIPHSIVVAGQDAPCAPVRPHPSVQALSIQFATGQHNPVTLAQDQRRDTTQANIEPCEGTGVVTAVTATTVTIRHAPIASRQWPAMTMTFTAADPRSLKDLAVGDRVGFDLKDGTDTPTVNRIMKR